MKFEVKNIYSGTIQFIAEIECENNENYSVKLGLAIQWGFENKANLGGANLRGAYLGGANLRGANLGDAYLGDADLRGANLGDADLRGANLGDADLRGANLGGAYLRDANFGGANLRGANLGENWIIQGPFRSDGYAFMLTNFKDEGIRVKAGCRNFSLNDAREHWNHTRKDTILGNETFIILDCLEAIAKARGLI